MFEDILKILTQHPIIPLIFSVVSLIITIKQCFVKRRFLTFRFIVVVILVLISLLSLFFYDYVLRKEIRKMVSQIIMLATEIATAIYIISTVEFTVVDAQIQQELNKSLNTLKYYVVLDKKDRIKEISNLLVEDLNVEFSEIYGMNFFDALEINKYRIIGFNQEAACVDDIKEMFNQYEKRVEEGVTSKFELLLIDDNRNEMSLYFNESPMFSNGKYKGRILIGEKKSEEDLIGIEHDLAITSSELNLIKSRFLSILENTNDGIFFNDVTQGSIWCNDTLVKKLNLAGNSLTIVDFYRMIHPDDLAFYQEAFKNMVDDKYEVSYRFNNGSGYVYIKEKGQKIVNGAVVELSGVMTVLDNSSFAKTDTSLDRILGESELLARLKTLEASDAIYEVVYFRVDSIPKINEKFGRVIGNTVLAQYVDFFKSNFINDNQIYRITGLEFVGIITDFRKMYILKNNLNSNEKMLHVSSTYINQKVETEIFMGISRSDDHPSKKNSLAYAKEALRICSNPQYKANYAYFKEIKR